MKTSVAVQIVFQRWSFDEETQEHFRELIQEIKRIVTYVLWFLFTLVGACVLGYFLWYFFSHKSMIEDSRETWSDLCENFLVTQGNQTGINCNRMWQNDFDIAGQFQVSWYNFACTLAGIIIPYALFMYWATQDVMTLPIVFMLLGCMSLYSILYPEEFEGSDSSSSIDDLEPPQGLA